MESHMEDESKLQALISLLDEPDYPSFIKVREQIFNFGTSAVPYLELAWENTFDTDVQQRIEDIIHNIHLNQLHFDLVKWSNSKETDLLEGYILFTKYHFPALDTDEIKQQVHRLKRDIWLELNESLTALEKVKVLNHIFFNHYKFVTPGKEESDVKYLFINNLLDTRIGYSISLGILYTYLAQSLNMPLVGLFLPGERYYMAWQEVDEFKTSKIRFCINPENKGGVFTLEELIALLRKLQFSDIQEYFIPLTPLTIIKRMFELLSYLYSAAGDDTKQDEISRLRDALMV